MIIELILCVFDYLDLPCNSAGFFVNPSQCNRFYRCIHDPQSNTYQSVEFDCPETLIFDQKLGVCRQGETNDEVCQAASTSNAASSPTELPCNGDGLFRHPGDCSKFYRCESGTTYQFSCTGGLIFDEAIQGCNYPGKKIMI